MKKYIYSLLALVILTVYSNSPVYAVCDDSKCDCSVTVRVDSCPNECIYATDLATGEYLCGSPLKTLKGEAGATVGENSSIIVPSKWLGEIQVPGIPVGGIDFVTGTVVPNAVNILLFFVMAGSLIMLIVGGIMWITANGDKEATAKAKATVTYAIVGLTLALGSFLIVNTIFYFLGIDIPR